MGKIFGDLAPLFVVEGLGVLSIDHCNEKAFKIVPKKIVHEDKLEGEQDIDYIGDRFDYDLIVHLFEYPDPSAKWNELQSFLHKEGSLCRDRSISNFFLDPRANQAIFYLDNLEPIIFAPDLEKWDCLIQFTSKTLVKFFPVPEAEVEGVEDDFGEVALDDFDEALQ